MDRPVEFIVIAAVCIGAYAGFVAFHKYANAQFKRRWHVWVELVTALILAAAGTYWMQPKEPVPIAIVWAALVAMSVAYIRYVRFCGNCGATIWPRGLGVGPKCARCGSETSAV